MVKFPLRVSWILPFRAIRKRWMYVRLSRYACMLRATRKEHRASSRNRFPLDMCYKGQIKVITELAFNAYNDLKCLKYHEFQLQVNHEFFKTTSLVLKIFWFNTITLYCLKNLMMIWNVYLWILFWAVYVLESCILLDCSHKIHYLDKRINRAVRACSINFKRGHDKTHIPEAIMDGWGNGDRVSDVWLR